MLLSLEYFSQPHAAYQKLSMLPGFVLLESSDKNMGRFDILSAYPYDQIKLFADTRDKIKELNRLSEILERTSYGLELPFQGGAIGYISYDLGAELQGIKSVPQSNLHDMPLLDIGLYDWAIIVDHHLKKVTLFAANEHETTQSIIQEIIALWGNTGNSISHFVVKDDFFPLISKGNYEESFYAILNALIEGRSYQVNYTQPFHAHYEGDAWGIYCTISQKNPVPFSAFMRTPDADVLSFSPERFILYDQGELLTSPIKGTMKRSANTLEDEFLKSELLHCDKNRAENVMIVDLSRNDFGKIAKAGTVRVPRLCVVQSFNGVHHLVSDVEAVCKDSLSPLMAFLSCFPGGSITGAPKLESMRIIQEQEPYSRGIYCGSIGYFSRHGRFDTNIAIRTVTAKNGVLHLAAGGGIVIDSVCSDEYQECYTKIAAIINGLKTI